MLACETPTRQDVFAGTVPNGDPESDQCGEFPLFLPVQQPGFPTKDLKAVSTGDLVYDRA
jgi:hypothetical protein